MEVVYCNSCGKRIPQEEFELGKVVRSEDDCYCRECVEKGVAPAGAAPVGAQTPRAERKARPAPVRRASRESPTSGMSARNVGVFLGALVMLGAGIYFGLLRDRRRTDVRERTAVPPRAIASPPSPGPGARGEPVLVKEQKRVPAPPPTPVPKEHKYVPTPPPASPPETDVPAPPRTGAPPDPPVPFAPKEGETVLYSWDYRHWPPGMGGKRLILRPGVNLLHTDFTCNTAWSAGGVFVVPERGIIRTRFFVTERADVYLLVGIEGRGNQRHIWRRVEPGKWFDGVVAMDSMRPRPWNPQSEPVSLPAGGKARQIVLHVSEKAPGVSRLYVSEIQVVAVE